ncbi:DUF805 domain-containing protein [Staphylococcus cohnii]|uniref:DUF805 domain-containing protein n=1 Tax=Staphylococcus TaxID=1279 RepID=UPI001AEBCD16|nr:MULTISPECIES: DUF805 domain-containing protein [Staphylococcus]MBZ8172044.1 DUF805 domain-containing protein [Staphylococcus cohnii]
MWHYYKLYWQNAFDFKGRARRKELWFPFLVNVLISILLAILLDHIFKIPMSMSDAISALFTIIIFIPDFSVATRRMHDIGRTMTFPIIFSIFFILFFIGSYITYGEGIFFNILEGILGIASIIFFILNIVAFFYMITDSDKTGNQYGLPRKSLE